ncbi:MAG: SbcC/MukB-like Walker B domain-containing protein, partial [Chloroflexota bacterium]|nr:SbcC/MukB-like Walker B domain-containing protein [Chloroflexota bacterium]
VAEELFSNLEISTKDLLRQQAVLEQQYKRLSNLEHEIELLSAQRKRLADQQSVYDELTIAFGKNGIQSLIIETSIPQLESDANEVLMHLTENRMSLKLQLTEGRKSRGGRASEELDIKVADEVGTRSYETYSGGEAFRINFAIRIALSKLLARRAGAPLQTLFIDEGFGSQDSEGQERLIEAIESIKDDFHKIIVITHIERIKEAFPIRIDVIKTESGSTFNIV